MLVRAAFRYRDRRAFARVVTSLRGGDSAHCEVAWAWSGQTHSCVSASFVDGGVRRKDIEMPPEKWRIYEVPAAIDPQRWYERHAGAGYDALGLLGILWPGLGHGRRRWFCSEVLADVLGLPQPHLYDLRTAESVCALLGKRVQ